MRTRIAAIAALTVFQSDPSIHRTAPQRDSVPMLTGALSMSADGAFVAFESLANLVAGDTNSSSVSDIYVLDVNSGRIELASIGRDGSPATGSSSTPSLSGDGRYVAFDSIASNLVPHNVPNCVTVFLHDRRANTSRAIVRSSADRSSILCGSRAAMSHDGRVIAFESPSVNLVDGIDENGASTDVYVTDVSAGTMTRVSVGDHGKQPSLGASGQAAISSDGRYVAFTSTACIDRTRPDMRAVVQAPCLRKVYVHDRHTARTLAVRAMSGNRPNGPTYSAALSADGRYVAFTSTATNLVRSDITKRSQIYIYDTEREESELVSRTPQGKPGNGDSSLPAIAGSGRFVVFQSTASDLTCPLRCAPGESDDNLVSDVFVLDRRTSRMQRLSRGPGRELWWTPSAGPVVDAAGRMFAFSSRHPTGPEDDRADFDLFIVKR